MRVLRVVCLFTSLVALASADVETGVSDENRTAEQEGSDVEANRAAFIESQNMNDEDKLNHHLHVGLQKFEAFMKAPPLSDAAGVAVYQATLQHAAAFNLNDKHTNLINDAMAHRLMTLYWGSEAMNAKTREGVQGVIDTQKTLLAMVQRIADVDSEQGDCRLHCKLAKKWWLKLMHLYFDKHAHAWRMYKKKLINAGMLDKSYTRPDLMEAHTEL